MDCVEEIEFEDRYLKLLRDPEMTKFMNEWFWESKAVDSDDNEYRIIWPLKENEDNVDPDWDNYRVFEWKV